MPDAHLAPCWRYKVTGPVIDIIHLSLQIVAQRRQTAMTLSFHTAKTIIRAAVAEAVVSPAAVDVAVVDAAGRLIAFNRMDGAEPVGAVGAPGKASLSTAFAAPSGELREAVEEPWARSLLDVLGVQVMVWSGAEPIFQDGKLVGAIGVAGAGPNDHSIALAALASAGLSHTAHIEGS